MHPIARALLAFLAWAASFALIGPVVFFVTVLLAGPHSDMLPSMLQPPVWLLGWGLLIVGPALISRVVWRRAGRATSTPQGTSSSSR